MKVITLYIILINYGNILGIPSTINEDSGNKKVFGDYETIGDSTPTQKGRRSLIAHNSHSLFGRALDAVQSVGGAILDKTQDVLDQNRSNGLPKLERNFNSGNKESSSFLGGALKVIKGTSDALLDTTNGALTKVEIIKNPALAIQKIGNPMVNSALKMFNPANNARQKFRITVSNAAYDAIGLGKKIIKFSLYIFDQIRSMVIAKNESMDENESGPPSILDIFRGGLGAVISNVQSGVHVIGFSIGSSVLRGILDRFFWPVLQKILMFIFLPLSFVYIFYSQLLL